MIPEHLLAYWENEHRKISQCLSDAMNGKIEKEQIILLQMRYIDDSFTAFKETIQELILLKEMQKGSDEVDFRRDEAWKKR